MYLPHTPYFTRKLHENITAVTESGCDDCRSWSAAQFFNSQHSIILLILKKKRRPQPCLNHWIALQPLP